MGAERADTLIVFVPGYTEQGPGVHLRGYVRWAIDTAPQLPTWPRPDTVEERSFAGYSGLRYTVKDPQPRHVDIVEVPWDARVGKLTGQPPALRIPRAASLLWINFISGVRVLGISPGYALASGLALVLMLLWFWLLISSTAAGIAAATQKNAPGSLSLAFVPGWLHSLWQLLQPNGWLYLGPAIAVVLLTAWKIDPGMIANIADLYDRFTHDGPEPESYVTTRSDVVNSVRDAVKATADASYGRIVLVGHSFGALIACAAAPELDLPETMAPIELVTVGTYFAYLDKLDGANMARLFDGVLTSKVIRWTDFFAKKDWLASNNDYWQTFKRRRKRGDQAPAHEQQRYIGTPVGSTWNVTFMDKLKTTTHRYYFKDPEVLRVIFAAP